MKAITLTAHRVAAALLLLLLSSIFCIHAFAETAKPAFTVDSVSALPGDTVTVNISVSNNPGILGGRLTLTYDDDLTLTKAAAGEAFGVLTFTKPGEFTSPCNFVWDGQELEQEDIKDGVILTLTFKVADGAKAGTTLPVSVSYKKGGFVDAGMHSVALEIVNGGVTIPKSVPPVEIQSAGYSNNVVTCTVSATDKLDKAVIILAAYENGGKMTGSLLYDAQLNKGVNNYSIACTLKGDYYKIFLINNSFIPLCECKRINIS